MDKVLICDRCGGTINPETSKCEYCGTVSVNIEERDSPDMIKSIQNNGIIILGSANNVQIQQGTVSSNQHRSGITYEKR